MWLDGKKFEARRQAKDEIIDWLLWYNRRRLHSTPAYVSPMKFDLSKTGLPINPGTPIRNSAMGYGFQGQS